MQDYVKLSLRKKPHHLIIHIGTKDISIKKQQVRIAKAIVELCVILSNIAVRDDSYQQKVTEKDQNWKELSEEKNIF